MKKIIRFLGIIIFSAFMLLPLKTNAQEPAWSQDLNLSDSVVSSLAKVEDGVVVMQYEGAASAENLLIKYDFNGNKIWEIDNNYGYNIESVSDGFIVWGETKIAKLNKDGNVIWNTNIEYKDNYTGGLGNKLVELDDGYVIGQTQFAEDEDTRGRDLFKISLQGHVEKRVATKELTKEEYGYDLSSYILAFGKSLDNNSLIMAVRCISTYDGINDLNISLLSPDLTPKSTYKNSLLSYDYSITNYFSRWNMFNNIIETDNGYILAGRKTITFSKEGKFNKIHNKILLDITKIDDNLYGYLIEQVKNSDYNYKTSAVKYDQNLKELSRIELPFSFSYLADSYNDDITSTSAATGFSQIKNRSVYYKNNDMINMITLNTPINWFYRRNGNTQESYSRISFPQSYSITEYELVNYRFADDETPSTDDNNSTVEGIINNIIKNPQTNSIIIIIVFVVLILAISITSYFVYKRKQEKRK